MNVDECIYSTCPFLMLSFFFLDCRVDVQAREF